MTNAFLRSADDDARRVLRVDEHASDDEIRAAYRLRARETHPDRPGGDPGAFRDVRAAFERLTMRRIAAGEWDQLLERTPARVDTVVVGEHRVRRSWDRESGFFRFEMLDVGRAPAALHRLRTPGATWVRERERVQMPARLRKRIPTPFIVLHGLLFPVTRPSGRLLALDLLYLDPASNCPYALVSKHRSWLLVRQLDGRLLAQNSRRGFSRLGGYAAFSDTSGRLEPIGERIFPPFEAPLVC